LQIASNLLKHHDWEVREQSALLLGAFATAKRAREIFHFSFPKLKELLEDKVLKVREAVS
jgi:HEAT repeat protein